jgi:hypothetical protein
MSKFILTYRYPVDYQAFGDPESLPAWQSFLERNAAHIVDPGWPIFDQPTVLGAAGAGTKLGGYSVIDVDDIDAATAVARTCPTLSRGGSVEIGALAQLPDEHQAEVQRRNLK